MQTHSSHGTETHNMGTWKLLMAAFETTVLPFFFFLFTLDNFYCFLQIFIRLIKLSGNKWGSYFRPNVISVWNSLKWADWSIYLRWNKTNIQKLFDVGSSKQKTDEWWRLAVGCPTIWQAQKYSQVLKPKISYIKIKQSTNLEWPS